MQPCSPPAPGAGKRFGGASGRRPRQTLAQLCQWVEREHGRRVSVTTLWKTLGRLGLTWKKTLHAAEQQSADVAQARHVWAAEQPHLDTPRRVFLDETWATTQMSHHRGRSPRGQRCVAALPYGHGKTTTFLCVIYRRIARRQPHRASLCEAEGAVAPDGCPHHRHAVGGDWRMPRAVSN
ncbi:winged helix-turn-helix domain-containing protein [Halomonas korlensis]|uniref:winged helix-turn-helix domain-containing protein n=1 Tax=Halomonas korlensis TaxID=463301 RepID=UPI001C3176AD